MAQRIFNGGKARELRESKDLSVKGLVESIDTDSELSYHPDTIRNVELGHHQPSTALALAWAAALEVKRRELLMDAPDEP